MSKIVVNLTEKFQNLTFKRKGETKKEDLLNCKHSTENVEIIEMICKLIAEELNNQALSDCHDPFLENHTMGMMQKIKDKQIKSLQIMEG